AGVFLLDQILGAGDEIIEDVLLFGEVATPVPFFAEFAAASEVGNGIDAALVQPDAANEVEARHLAAAVAAVAVENARVPAVKPCAFLANDVERNARAIFRDSEIANHFAVAEVGRRSAKQGRLVHLARM